jgi:hypothetical protein
MLRVDVVGHAVCRGALLNVVTRAVQRSGENRGRRTRKRRGKSDSNAHGERDRRFG